MKRDMKQWVADTIAAPVKKPMPVLSFPAVQLMGITVRACSWWPSGWTAPRR